MKVEVKFWLTAGSVERIARGVAANVQVSEGCLDMTTEGWHLLQALEVEIDLPTREQAVRDTLENISKAEAELERKYKGACDNLLRQRSQLLALGNNPSQAQTPTSPATLEEDDDISF